MKIYKTLLDALTCTCAHCLHQHFPLPGENPIWNPDKACAL